MFLRAKTRKKDGKLHRYFSVVENQRVRGGRVVQRHVLYLGGDQLVAGAGLAQVDRSAGRGCPRSAHPGAVSRRSLLGLASVYVPVSAADTTPGYNKEIPDKILTRDIRLRGRRADRRYDPAALREPRPHARRRGLPELHSRSFHYTSRAIPTLCIAWCSLSFRDRDRRVDIYPDSQWQSLSLANDYHHLDKDAEGARNLDQRTKFFYGYTVNTPKMMAKIVGGGSQYGVAFSDSSGQPFDGSRNYRINVPANVPVLVRPQLAAWRARTTEMTRG